MSEKLSPNRFLDVHKPDETQFERIELYEGFIVSIELNDSSRVFAINRDDLLDFYTHYAGDLKMASPLRVFSELSNLWPLDVLIVMPPNARRDRYLNVDAFLKTTAELGLNTELENHQLIARFSDFVISRTETNQQSLPLAF